MPLEDIDDLETGETDRDVDRIMCCSIVNSYVLEILRGADPDSIAKQLKEGQKDPERLKAYRGIVEEKREEYERKVAALKLLRDKIDIALKNSEIPDDNTSKDSGIDVI